MRIVYIFDSENEYETHYGMPIIKYTFSMPCVIDNFIDIFVQ